MRSIEIDARAKINLSLDVLRKRPDGYHDVRMIMQALELHDTIFIETKANGISLEDSSGHVPLDSRNTAYKAAELLIRNFNIKTGVRIRLEKRIPVAAGLAGGSADAAAVLKGMNSLFSLELSMDELMKLGKSIGADVPFCILGGTALAEGIGEVLTELSPLQAVSIVLVKPKASVSTKWVYDNLNLSEIALRPDTELLISAIREKRIDVLAQNMVNVLETVTAKRIQDIGEIKEKLMEYGALGSMMSGSGPTVFGLFGDKAAAEYACDKMKNYRWETILTETFCKGG